ncbi:MAG: hypothetical protein ISP24_04875 [Rickettsiales bacterium]|nr:hypothetical protein [Rickettsiales bacterium]
MIWPLKESEVLVKAGVKVPKNHISSEIAEGDDTLRSQTDMDNSSSQQARSYPEHTITILSSSPPAIGEAFVRTTDNPSKPKTAYKETKNVNQKCDKQTNPGLPLGGPDDIRWSYSRAHAKLGGLEDSPSTPARPSIR